VNQLLVIIASGLTLNGLEKKMNQDMITLEKFEQQDFQQLIDWIK
jgi:hypothetical protein